MIAAVIGVFGLVIKRLNLPVVPIILGMVLGGIAETKFRTSMARIDTPLDFINRPICAIIFTLILVAIASHIYSLYRGKTKAVAASDL